MQCIYLHNMIGDMQLIAEIYDILKELANLSNPQMADVFSAWNEGKHNIHLYLLLLLLLSLLLLLLLLLS